MNKACRLLLNSLHNAWMAMAGRYDGNAGVEVQIMITIDIPDITSPPSIDDKGIHPPGYRREHFSITCDDCLGSRTRPLRHNVIGYRLCHTGLLAVLLA